MALDGAFLSLAAEGLKFLESGRVQKISRIGREEFVFEIHRDRVNYSIVIGMNSASARIVFDQTDGARQNGGTSVSPFLLKLRKSLIGGRLVKISQKRLDRILLFDFACHTEIGEPVKFCLIAEFTGRSGNLILCEYSGENINEQENLIISEALKKTDPYSYDDKLREIYPKIKYVFPKNDFQKLSLKSFLNEKEIMSSFERHKEEKLAKVFFEIFEGTSPLLGREAAYLCGELDITVNDALKNPKFMDFVNKISNILTGKISPFFNIVVLEGKAREFSFVEISQYGELAEIKHYESANGILTEYFREKSEQSRTEAKLGGLLKSIENLISKTRRKIEARESDLLSAEEFGKFKLFGDLIMSNIWRIKKGDRFFETENDVNTELASETVFEPDGKLYVPLDPRFGAAENAAVYYSKYKKLKNARETLTVLLAQANDELEYLLNAADSAGRAVKYSESSGLIEEIVRDLKNEGFFGEKWNIYNGKSGINQKKNVKNPKLPKSMPPLKFMSESGFEILCGRNNRQNEILVFKTASKTDYWFHVQGIPGAHVILRCAGKLPDLKTFYFAAKIAAENSSGKIGVSVDYTQVKNVKKIPGAKPGNVIFSDFKTIFVKL